MPSNNTYISQRKHLPVKYSGNRTLTTASISMTIGGQPITLDIPLPTEKVSAETMLPLFQALTNFLVDMSVKATEKEGKQISCRKGCGACCSQLVPITKLEANYLKKVVRKMPDSRQSVIHTKFKEALKQLAEAKLLEKLKRPQNLNKDQRIQLGLDYFKLDIPCPFLEDQSCSIHSDRPMACREYLVTSPVKSCSEPHLGEIEGIKIPRKVSHAVTRLTKQKKGTSGASWSPLILILENQQKVAHKQKLQSGVDWLKEILSNLS